MTTPQRYIVEVNEGNLERYGDEYRGVGYTRTPDEPFRRYAMMLEVIRERDEPVSVLDVGCGLAHMLDHLQATPELARRVRYTGLDMSEKYLAAARARQPEADLVRVDLLDPEHDLGEYDYATLVGIFTYRGELDRDAMVAYWKQMLLAAWRHCRRGIAFNVMSKIVDWERDDLFHVSFDEMAEFVSQHMSRHFVVRHDYGDWEYTTYVYR